jgi:hypothetical protein
MRIIEPVSSALLLTSCIYVAGISQNNAFLKEFGMNPELSQPEVPKALYDGGIITLEVFWRNVETISDYLWLLLPIIVIGALLFLYRELDPIKRFNACLVYAKNKYVKYNPTSYFLLSYIIYLTFTSYGAGKADGIELAKLQKSSCRYSEIVGQDYRVKACVFRKDRDLIWYYIRNSNGYIISYKPITSLKEIILIEHRG